MSPKAKPSRSTSGRPRAKRTLALRKTTVKDLSSGRGAARGGMSGSGPVKSRPTHQSTSSINTLNSTA